VVPVGGRHREGQSQVHAWIPLRWKAVLMARAQAGGRTQSEILRDLIHYGLGRTEWNWYLNPPKTSWVARFGYDAFSGSYPMEMVSGSLDEVLDKVEDDPRCGYGPVTLTPSADSYPTVWLGYCPACYRRILVAREADRPRAPWAHTFALPEQADPTEWQPKAWEEACGCLEWGREATPRLL
jgi:hypothetical protein